MPEACWPCRPCRAVGERKMIARRRDEKSEDGVCWVCWVCSAGWRGKQYNVHNSSQTRHLNDEHGWMDGGGRAAGGAQRPGAELGIGTTAHLLMPAHACHAHPPGRPQLLIPLSFPLLLQPAHCRPSHGVIGQGTPNPPVGSWSFSPVFFSQTRFRSAGSPNPLEP